MRIDGSRVGTSKTILARLVEARDGHVGFAMFRAVMVEAATALWLKPFDDGYLGQLVPRNPWLWAGIPLGFLERWRPLVDKCFELLQTGDWKVA